MFDSKAQEIIDKILSLLGEEIMLLGKSIKWNTAPDILTLKCSDSYTSTLWLKEGEAHVISHGEEFVERDLVDGLYRMRMELVRHLTVHSYMIKPDHLT